MIIAASSASPVCRFCDRPVPSGVLLAGDLADAARALEEALEEERKAEFRLASPPPTASAAAYRRWEMVVARVDVEITGDHLACRAAEATAAQLSA